jgi:RNase P/RNase MRP subunit p29
MDDALKEAYELISGESVIETRAKLVYDKKQKQFSVKIPKKIADKMELDSEKYEFKFTLTVKADKLGLSKKLNIEMVVKDGEKEVSS